MTRIERASFSTVWPTDAFYNELSTNKLAHYFVGRFDDRIVAYGGIWVILEDSHVTTLAVDPDYRGRRFGEVLLLRLIDEAIERGAAWMTLEVRESNVVGAAALSQVRIYDGDDARRLLQRRQRERARSCGPATCTASSIAIACARCARRSSTMTRLAFTRRCGAFANTSGQQHRYAHSVRVARCAEVLARRHGADPRKARLAGLLHDLARLYSPRTPARRVRGAGLRHQRRRARHPMLLHARLGAALAREQFGVEDAEVLSAIEKHTTGGRRDVARWIASSISPIRSNRSARLPERGGTVAARADDSRRRCADADAAMRRNERKGVAPAPETLAAAREIRARGPRGGTRIGELIEVVRESALDKKGEAFAVLDVSGRTILADTFAIVTGRSKIQTRAIADAVVEAVRRERLWRPRIEGYADGRGFCSTSAT